MTKTSVIELPYAWLRLGAAVALSTIGGVGMWSIVVALPAVQAEFGVTRGSASLPYTLAMVGFMAGTVLMGRLADRFGIMVPMLLGTVMLSIGYVLTSFAGGITSFAILYGLLVGLLGGSAMFAPLLADTSLWFDRRRGLAIGLCASGNYFAGTLWPPVIEHFIAEIGWRETHVWIGVFCLVTMLPLALVLRRRPPARRRRRRPSTARRPSARDRSACRPIWCRACWWWRAWAAASPCRCRRCISWPIASTWAMARRAVPRCCR